MNPEPMVTVLMPVYNASCYLREAIGSILLQTLRDFEFIIVDDGSTDESRDIINSYPDTRIKVISHKTNLGLITALNTGIDNARGRYIARMDADDISAPERLEKQVEFMEMNSEIGVLGTWYETFGKENHKEGLPVDPAEVKCHLLFHSPISVFTLSFDMPFSLKN
jgi:glycosyltransferase involved in cell wall biosynthesis